MHTAVACQALQSGHCLEVRYDGYVRIVEVHACGWTKEGHAVMRVWQVRGGSVSNEPVCWKLLRFERQLAPSCSMSCPPLPGSATSGETEPLSASSANSNPPQSHSCPYQKLIPMAEAENRGMMRPNDRDLDTAPIPPRRPLR